MGYPLKAYFGRRTLAYLHECCFCGKPYAETGEWNTLQGTDGEVTDVWLIACDECFGKLDDGDYAELLRRMRGAG